jgi:hypothetical protein
MENFYIDDNGNMTASGATISGNVGAGSLSAGNINIAKN